MGRPSLGISGRSLERTEASLSGARESLRFAGRCLKMVELSQHIAGAATRHRGFGGVPARGWCSKSVLR
jgi:hypothetical protein